ncbi:MAG: DUF2911 domain-containing protein [Gemmatimonadaceae bacterium]
MSARTSALASVLLAVYLVAPALLAQPGRKSQHATLTQTIGPLEVSLAYNRPVARGRTLFGGIVPFGKVWNPGADTATAITFSRDVLIAGHMLSAGSYSLWMIPGADVWTIIFSSATPVFHVPYPPGHDVLRVRVPARHGEHMEALAFYFPLVEADAGTLVLHWGTSVVPIDVRVK